VATWTRQLVSHRGDEVRLVILCVGRLGGSAMADDVSHFEKMLSRQARVETIELREAGGDPMRRGESLRREAKTILGRIPDDAYVCVLDREGQQLSSEDLALWMGERRREGTDVWFVIGGPFGLDGEVFVRANYRLSFGRITLPHQLARVVLLEQLFRVHKILAGEPYHY
jgi:23S rRNA (pseudouridine1915-N3)-methyltransferase